MFPHDPTRCAPPDDPGARLMPPDEYADEIDRLEARSASDPRTHTFARLADLYRKAGELQRALEVVESGLRHHPHYLNARIVHARLLRELGRQGEAISAFERVLRIDSQNLVAQAALDELREGEAGRTPGATEVSEPRPAASGWLARLEEDWHSGRGRGDEPEAAYPEGATPPETGPPGELGEPGESGETGASEPDEPETGAPEPDTPVRAPEPETVASRSAASPRPRAAIRREGGDLETATLAELYARQGLFDEAIGIFERLLARDPYNARLAAALEDARHQARGRDRPRSSNGQGGGDDAGERFPDDAEEPMPEDAAGPATGGAPRPDPRRGETRTGRSAGVARLSSGAPVPAGSDAPTDAESIRAFLARLLEGRFETPGDERDEVDIDLGEWLEARRAQ